MARVVPDTDLIKYRYARTADGAFVNIFDYAPGDVALCVGCDRPMVGRRGRLKQWHFAHKADPVDSCSIETVVHRLGKAFIKEGFDKAVEEKRPFELRWPCPRCTKSTAKDCTKVFTGVEVEGSPTAGVRSDLILRGESVCAVEIVVTHDLDEQTSRLYANAKIPVFVVRPTWETLEHLRTGISAESLRFAGNINCPGCRALDELAKTQDIVAFLARMCSDLEKKPRFPASMLPTRRWSMRSDQQGRDLAPEVQEALLRHAAALATFGFVPLRKRLLLNRYLPHAGNLYAVLRGTREAPISNDPRPFFHLELHARIVGVEARVLIRERLRECLERLGLTFRDVFVSPESEQAAYLLPRE